MDTNNVIENIDPQVPVVRNPKSNKLFILGLVVAISLTTLFVFLILVYFFVPGKKETVNSDNLNGSKQVVTTAPVPTDETAVMSGSDEVTDIDKDLTNTEIPSIDADLLQIEQQVGL